MHHRAAYLLSLRSVSQKEALGELSPEERRARGEEGARHDDDAGHSHRRGYLRTRVRRPTRK